MHSLSINRRTWCHCKEICRTVKVTTQLTPIIATNLTAPTPSSSSDHPSVLLGKGEASPAADDGDGGNGSSGVESEMVAVAFINMISRLFAIALRIAGTFSSSSSRVQECVLAGDYFTQGSVKAESPFEEEGSYHLEDVDGEWDWEDGEWDEEQQAVATIGRAVSPGAGVLGVGVSGAESAPSAESPQEPGYPKKQAPVSFLTDPAEGRSTLRPADVLVYGWVGGKHTCVDLTGVSPLVGFGSGVFTVGQAANNAASAKVRKHEQACIDNQHAFIPFAFDTFGFLAPEAIDLLKRIQRVMNSNVMTPGNIEYVFRRIGFAIQKGVAAQLVARLPSI